MERKKSIKPNAKYALKQVMESLGKLKEAE